MVPQRLHLGSDEAEVLCTHGQLEGLARPAGLLPAELCGDGLEEGPPRRLDPLALNCVLVFLGVLCVDAPEGLEAAEVVDADEVDQLHGRAESVHPPLEPVALRLCPVVDRVSPELSSGAEVVWRHARHAQRLPGLGVEVELLGAAPHVAAVAVDVDGHVPEDRHALAVGVPLQGTPLLEKHELEVLVEVDAIRMGRRRLLEGTRRPQPQLPRPLVPRLAGVDVPQRHEEREGVEPAALRLAEVDEPPRTEPALALEVLKRLAKELHLVGHCRVEVDVCGVLAWSCGWEGREVAVVEVARLGEFGGADEQRVAGEGAEGHVWRVAHDGVGRAEGEDLPVLEARLDEEVDELVGGRAHVAHTIAARQRRGVQHNASRAGEGGLLRHSFSLVKESRDVDVAEIGCLLTRKYA
mmetsp:Transcript_47250/g.117953  ORF Transcript_47250/g.117953 Transcript_47250/m.117953 type:complete len:410 (-) Transcript_47250:32-1261(-)